MAETKKSAESAAIVDELAIAHLAQMAGISIAPDRAPGAAERLNDMLAFLHELDDLEIGEEAPASVFDPAWETDAAS